mgnify:CR=1 FL=1
MDSHATEKYLTYALAFLRLFRNCRIGRKKMTGKYKPYSQSEQGRLKRLLADALLENEVTKEALRKKW